jgi:hypothetical protein
MKSIRSQYLVLLATGASLLLAAGSGAEETGGVRVLRTIPFSAESGASQNVQDECQLQTKVPQFLGSFSKSVELVDGPLGTDGRVLELEISQVHAPGGGAWSGAKSMTVKGTLRENGEEIGTFIATRYSGGGAFGGYKGTCGIVGRCAKAIGKDIAGWLAKPGKDSRLGDA